MYCNKQIVERADVLDTRILDAKYSVVLQILLE